MSSFWQREVTALLLPLLFVSSLTSSASSPKIKSQFRIISLMQSLIFLSHYHKHSSNHKIKITNFHPLEQEREKKIQSNPEKQNWKQTTEWSHEIYITVPIKELSSHSDIIRQSTVRNFHPLKQERKLARKTEPLND